MNGRLQSSVGFQAPPGLGIFCLLLGKSSSLRMMEELRAGGARGPSSCGITFLWGCLGSFQVVGILAGTICQGFMDEQRMPQDGVRPSRSCVLPCEEDEDEED